MPASDPADGAVTAYPLQWPFGRQRRASRVEGRFHVGQAQRKGVRYVTVDDARTRLAVELDRMGATDSILSSNVVLRVNGQPRSGQPNPVDPGAAVYFKWKGKRYALACDRFTEVAQNIAGIAAHIEATRTIERHGCASLEQMFTGFQALPAPKGPDDWFTILNRPKTKEQAELTFRIKMLTAHPDHGGSTDDAAALNAAIAIARQVLS